MLASGAGAADFSSIFVKNTNSVVTIAAGKHLGTGFYAAPNFIVTNFHVIVNAPAVSFCNTYKSGFTKVDYVVVADRKHDLAIIYTEKEGRPVSFAKATDLVPGMELASIGSPQGYEKTIASGNFSQMRQNGLMQISIPESPGSSGSPVFNQEGLVVGVVVAQKTEAQNLNFAIPSEAVLRLLEEAKALPKEKYIALAKFQENQEGGAPLSGNDSVANDYSNVDLSLPHCKKFVSVFFEVAGKGPVKKCTCNDVVTYTNLLCQCHPCRNKEPAPKTVVTVD